MHSFLFRARESLAASTLVLLALALAAPAAQAQATLYTSAVAFRAAAPTVGDPFQFDGYADPGDVYYYGHNCGFDGISFTSDSLRVLSPESGYGDLFGGHQYLSGYAGSPLFLDLRPGSTAFGADFASLGGGPMQITVNYDQVFRFESGTTFAGFISRDPITHITIDGGDDGSAINGILYRDAAPVPEVSSVISLGLLLLGAGGSVAATRRKKAGKAV